jgi:hypothetical protein
MAQPPMSETLPRRGLAWKVVGIALGCLGLGVLLVGILAFLNWESLTNFGRRTASSLQQLSAVQAAVAGSYATSQVKVMNMVHSSRQGPYLSIEVVNSPRLRDLTADLARAEALNVATLARDTLGPAKPYDSYEVIFTKAVGAGLSFSTRQRFSFASSDLPAPPIAVPPPP